MAFSYRRLGSACWILSLGREGLVPLRTEAERAGRSLSGGGVGGKAAATPSGSGACLLEDKPGLTRLVAAKEILSGGRSSLPSDLPAWNDG